MRGLKICFDVLAVLAFLSQELCHVLGLEVLCMKICSQLSSRGKWVPAITAWRVLRLWMEERSPIWEVVTNILNKQSRTDDKVRSSSLVIARGAKNSSS